MSESPVLSRYITAVIRSRLRLAWVTGEDVEQVYGVLKTNGVGHVSQGARLCYLYPEVSLMSHSCLPNMMMISSSPARQISFVATTEIPAGCELSWSYSNILYGRHQRQHHLSSTWLFDCSCERCEDPTELGLQYSALQCLQCGGYLTLTTLHSLACPGCEANINKAEARQSEQNLLKTISTLQPDGVADLLRQLTEDSRYHKTHHVVTRAAIR